MMCGRGGTGRRAGLRNRWARARGGSTPSARTDYYVVFVTVVLVTGMSGTGKSTALVELARRGHRVVDTDYGGWTEETGA